MSRLSIGQLAKAANVSIHTIRYYEKAGLLPQPARQPYGFRQYAAEDLLQLKFVRQARSLGFPLKTDAVADPDELPASMNAGKLS